MIPLIKPAIPFDAVADGIREILASGQLTSGRNVAGLEAGIARYVGTRHAFATTSATTALHMTLVALGIGPGDEVLVSDFTFPASGNAIAQTGARPVLVDCLPGRFDMDPADLERRLTPRAKAVMVVHPFGQPAEMAAINAIAARHGLRVIEDAACALGARRPEGRCGALSLAGCFSFHPRKLLSTGEGGMITTDDDALAAKIAILRNHGSVRAEVGMDFIDHGFNYRMSEIQACLGLAQLDGFDAMIAERRTLAAAYLRLFADVPGVTVPLSASPEACSFQSFVVLFAAGIDRDAVIRFLRGRGIESTLGTYAMHSHAAFARYGYRPGDLPNSLFAQRQSLTLPLFGGLAAADLERIVAAVADAIKDSRCVPLA